MTELSLAATRVLVEDEELTALLPFDDIWPTYIFDENPRKVHIENTGGCLIVVSEQDPYTSANEHNTLKFPELLVDIWADPERRENGSVRVANAKRKIEKIEKLIDKHFHLVNRASTEGSVVVWGNPTQIANKTGVVIAGSHRLNGSPSYSPIKDTEDAWMGRLRYGVHKL